MRVRLPAGLADDPAGRRALGEALGDALAALHRIHPAEVGLADYGRPEGFVRRQASRWSRQWDASNNAAVAAIDDLALPLARTVPVNPVAAIVRGDYRLGTCIVGLQDPSRLAAVLGWELSTLGDPLTDLGMLIFHWSDAADVIPTLIHGHRRTRRPNNRRDHRNG